MSEKQMETQGEERLARPRTELLLARKGIDETLGAVHEQSTELHLKEKSTFQLEDMLFAGAVEWHKEDRAKLNEAISLAEILHATDTYKGKPYVVHPLRVANRIMHYLEIKDPPVIFAAILHDGVEDHADKLANMYYERHALKAEGNDLSPADMQRVAFLELEQTFGKRASDIVAAVTNPPSEEKPADYEDRLAAYATKVEAGIKTKEAYAVKVCDWCEHGPGIVYGEVKKGKPLNHFPRKYGLVQPVYERRFYQPDMQSYLSPVGKRYLTNQFALGRERLLVPTS